MSLTLGEIEQRIPEFYAASVEDDGTSFHFTSAPGRGKTSLMKEAPAIIHKAFGGNYGFAYINGATSTLGMLCGFQQLISTRESGDKSEYLRSVFSRPFWWWTKEGYPLEHYDGGFVFVDEKDKMDIESKKLIADARLEKRVANHWLPSRWVVWTAGNRPQDRSGSTKELDFEINRSTIIDVRDSATDLAVWCRNHDVTPESITFIEKYPHVVFMEPPKVQGPYCTPRSLVHQDKYLRSYMNIYSTKKFPLDVQTQSVVAGGIGKEAAEQLFLHIRMGQELPSYDRCIATPESISIPAEPDRLRLMAYKMADAAQIRDTEPLMQFMTRFPNEFQVMFVRMLKTRNTFFFAQPAVRDWCSKNASLIALLNNYQMAAE